MLRNVWTGFISRLRPGMFKYEGVHIFYYHGVVQKKQDPVLERNLHLLSDFKAHIDLLKRFKVIGLEEIPKYLKGVSGIKRSVCVITFDDGYANNLEAAEVLKKASLPWTLFVSTGECHAGGMIWTVELSLLMLHGKAQSLSLFGGQWHLSTRMEREETFRAIRLRMKTLDSLKREEAMKCLRDQFPPEESQRLLKLFPQFQMLTWEKIKQLSNAGVEIGSHGVYHEIHHENQLLEVRKTELTESKREIEKHTQKNCRFFAFPNGDYMPQSAEEVKRAGYELALTTEEGIVSPAANSYLLPRLGAPSSLSSFTSKVIGAGS